MGFAQEASVEELQKNIATAKNDSIKTDLYNDLAFLYTTSGDLEQGKATVDQALKLAKQVEYPAGEAEALKILGIISSYQDDRYNAINYSKQALDLYRKLGDTLGMANMESNIGAFYVDIGSALAIDYIIPSIQKSEQLKDTVRIMSATLNLAAFYFNKMKQPEKAEEYFKQAKAYLDTGFEGQEDWSLNYQAYQGEFALYKEEYEAALAIFEKMLPAEEGGPYHSETLRKIGSSLYGLKRNREAEQVLVQAIEVAETAQSFEDMVSAQILYGKVIRERSPQQAVNVFEEALDLAASGGYLYELEQVHLELYNTYRNIGQYSDALRHHEYYLELKDSILNIEVNDKVRYAQLNFDLDKKEDQIQMLEQRSEIADLQQKRQKSVTIATIAVAGLLLLLVLGMFNRYKFIKKANSLINKEKERSENLLLNILPEETAQELKEKGSVKAKHFDSVTVMFTDFVGFTKSSETMGPEELVRNVDYFFSKFDTIIEKYGLEKIKTIGDAYMCAAGLPFPSENHAQKMLLAALDIIDFVDQVRNDPNDGIPGFEIRIGIHTGPVVAGVVGTKKFAYDIWGDTVNVASRMESGSHSGRINISETTYDLVREQFKCTYRGEIEVKNKGMLKMYFVNSIKDKSFVTEVLEETKAG
ncbi:adenylate/guanylate cyclase domain-containing protein [Robertkochia marina]|nr:adenylate/guanylate cyclase domain-containing protein [Robertkochia marina]